MYKGCYEDVDDYLNDRFGDEQQAIDADRGWLYTPKRCQDCCNYYGYDIDPTQHMGFCTVSYDYVCECEDASDCEEFRE